MTNLSLFSHHHPSQSHHQIKPDLLGLLTAPQLPWPSFYPPSLLILHASAILKVLKFEQVPPLLRTLQRHSVPLRIKSVLLIRVSMALCNQASGYVSHRTSYFKIYHHTIWPLSEIILTFLQPSSGRFCFIFYWFRIQTKKKDAIHWVFP